VAAESGVPSEIAPYLNYGVLGLFVVAIIMGWVWAKPAVDRLIAERDRLILEKQRAEEQRDAALSIAQEQIVPLLTTFVTTTQTLIPLLQEIVRDGNDDHRRTH
jgi:hypothetical protein